ncbi:MAG: aminotransferase class IV [Lentisphaerae bacterium]|nr:aminotransferase class IV [Lentisphaerota bacterium]
MTGPIAYLKGKFIAAQQAMLPVNDAAIVLGATVTEMTRTFHHKPFKLEEHIDRLYRSTKYVRFHTDVTREEMTDLTMKVVDHNAALIPEKKELGIIHFVTAGAFSIYAGSAGGNEKMIPTVCVHTFPLPLHLWAKGYEKGIHAVTPSTRHVPPQCIDPKMKYRSRLHYWLAEQEAKLVDPAAATLLLDLDGNVSEFSGGNIMIVKDGAIISPPARNILPGISRQTVIELARELDLPFVEREIQVYDVCNADEAFESTTPICLLPVTKINNIPIGDGRPGPICSRLLSAWGLKVGLDIVAQIRSDVPWET